MVFLRSNDPIVDLLLLPSTQAKIVQTWTGALFAGSSDISVCYLLCSRARLAWSNSTNVAALGHPQTLDKSKSTTHPRILLTSLRSCRYPTGQSAGGRSLQMNSRRRQPPASDRPAMTQHRMHYFCCVVEPRIPSWRGHLGEIQEYRPGRLMFERYGSLLTRQAEHISLCSNPP